MNLTTELIYQSQDYKKLQTKKQLPQLIIDTSLLNLTVSVVIPVKNGEQCIADCLHAIFSQSFPPTEVIIVDGGSTDRTVEIASQYSVTIVHETYGTVGGARQLGLKTATGKYVAFTDADCVPEKDWLKNIISEFDEETVGIGGGILNVGNNFWETSVALSRDTFLGSAQSVQGRVFKEKRSVKSISGCNSVYCRETLNEIGGFNTTLSMNEETELNKRLATKGKLLYIPNASVSHNQRRGLRAFAKQMIEYGRGRGKNKLWALQCIPPVVAPLLILSLLFAPALLPVVSALYIAGVFVIGTKIAAKNRNIKYVVSMPIVFTVEHAAYTVGFWKGLFEGLIP